MSGMHDGVDNLVPEEPPAPDWKPSSFLRERLQAGILGAFLAGGLWMASAGAELANPNAAGWGLADNLAWAALLPLGLVLRAYLTLGHETGSFALRKSASCLFGTLVLLDLLELASRRILPPGWQIAVWVLFGLGLLALLGGLFVSESGLRKPAVEPAAGASRRAGVLGGAAAALLVVLKLAGKGFLAKFVAMRVIARLLRNVHGDWSALTLGVLLLLAIAFLVWLAACKIRLRRTLGSVAAVTGWAEVLLVVGLLAAAGCVIAAALLAVEQPGLNQQAQDEIHADMERRFALLGLLAAALWTGITALFFVKLRGPADAEQDWLEEGEEPNGGQRE